MLLILLGVLILHVITLILLIVSTAASVSYTSYSSNCGKWQVEGRHYVNKLVQTPDALSIKHYWCSVSEPWAQTSSIDAAVY